MHQAAFHELLALIPLSLLQFVLQYNENYLFLQAPQPPKRGNGTIKTSYYGFNFKAYLPFNPLHTLFYSENNIRFCIYEYPSNGDILLMAKADKRCIFTNTLKHQQCS
jgi:hypothetical protein